MDNAPFIPSSTAPFAHGAGDGLRQVWLPWHEGGRATLKVAAGESEPETFARSAEKYHCEVVGPPVTP
jgi:hypothetical protein